jgi:coenzyme Q-binding protein COQ10
VKSRYEEHRLPWRAEMMFDLVADIERYHEFLPVWTHARITQRQGDFLTVMQGIDLGFTRLDFESRAELHRPERLQVRSSAGPFRDLLIDWRFTPVPDDGCVVRLAVSLEMRSSLLELASGRVLDLMTRDILRRFQARAEQLYGN